MPFPTQQDLPQQVQNHLNMLEMLTKVAGFSGSAIALIKVSVAFLNDQSFKRKIAKAAGDIDGLLTQLRQLKTDPWVQHGGTLDGYQAHLEEDLGGKLERLSELKVEAKCRAERRNAEPEGIRRWLLLYRPEGFDGFTMQSWFYFLVSITLFALAMAFKDDVFSIVLVLMLPLIGGAFYVRSIALRLKRTGNAVRLRCAAAPNGDLGGFRRTLVLWVHGQWVSRSFFYLFFLSTVWLQIYQFIMAKKYPGGSVWEFLLVCSVIFLTIAQIFRVDALSRRAKRIVFGAGSADAVAVPEGASAV